MERIGVIFNYTQHIPCSARLDYGVVVKSFLKICS